MITEFKPSAVRTFKRTMRRLERRAPGYSFGYVRCILRAVRRAKQPLSWEPAVLRWAREDRANAADQNPDEPRPGLRRRAFLFERAAEALARLRGGT